MMLDSSTTPTTTLVQQAQSLPALVARAAETLANAKTAAEVLEAAEIASFAYDVAKRQARLAKAKKAHDDLIGAVYRAQADALEIEAQAKRRLADEYDAAQQRGEVATGRDGPGAGVLDGNAKVTAADLGLSRKDIHEARQIRDAEEAEPGIVRETLDAKLAAGEEPTRAAVRAAVEAGKKKAKRGKRHQVPAPTTSQHERDLELIRSFWAGICQSSHREFLVAAAEDLMDIDTVCAVLRALLNRKHPKNVAGLLVDAFDRSEFGRAVADSMIELLDEPEVDDADAEAALGRGVAR